MSSTGIKPTRIAGEGIPLSPTESLSVSYVGDDVDFDATIIDNTDQWKQPCRVATTAGVTISTALNAGDTIDGVTLASGDRVLVKDQSTASQNGIYVAGTSPARAADLDEDEEVRGAIVYVIAGTANTGTAWKVTNTAATVVGTDAINWAAFGSGSTSFGTPAIVLGTAAAAGAASTAVRTDATIVAFDATAPTTQALGDSAAAGSAAVAARRDHKHAMPTAAVTTSGLTQATGKLLGRSTAGSGAVEELTVGSGLTLSAGSLTASGGGGGGLTYLGATTLGSDQSTISITGISGAYKDLVVVFRLRGTDAGAGIGASLRVGSGSIDTGSNYGYAYVYAGWTGGSSHSASATSATFCAMPNSGATSGVWGYVRAEFMNYADTAKGKGWIAHGISVDGSGGLQTTSGGVWKNTSAALDQIQLTASAGNFLTGSRVEVYGRS